MGHLLYKHLPTTSKQHLNAMKSHNANTKIVFTDDCQDTRSRCCQSTLHFTTKTQISLISDRVRKTVYRMSTMLRFSEDHVYRMSTMFSDIVEPLIEVSGS